MAVKSGEVDTVITGWETLCVINLQDFDSGEWLILFQWVDEPLTDLPQKNVPLVYHSRAMKRSASYSSSA